MKIVNRQIDRRKGMVFMVIFFILIGFFAFPVSQAAYNIEKADLYSKGNCGQLLKKDGSIVNTSYVVYQYKGKEYPAYCLDKLKGRC